VSPAVRLTRAIALVTLNEGCTPLATAPPEAQKRGCRESPSLGPRFERDSNVVQAFVRPARQIQSLVVTAEYHTLRQRQIFSRSKANFA